MAAFRTIASEKFDQNNPEHVQKLKELWKFAFGDKEDLGDNFVNSRWYATPARFGSIVHLPGRKLVSRATTLAETSAGLAFLVLTVSCTWQRSIPKYVFHLKTPRIETCHSHQAFQRCCNDDVSGEYPFVITAFNISCASTMSPISLTLVLTAG